MEYVTVAQEGFYGLYHVPVKDHDPKKVVIVVGGSEGNENIPMNVGAMFARCGIAALGICYWNVDGLPKELVRVPVDPFEKAILWLKNKGYEKIIMYGISKGAELVLLCASLMPDICGVVALSPIHCIWGGMYGNKSMASKTFSSASEFTYRGKDFPCMTAHLKYGPAIRNLILHQQFELSYIYEEPLKHFDEDTAIHVENIQGNILFIYAKEDLMWPSKEAVAYMVNRLEKHRKYQGGHHGNEADADKMKSPAADRHHLLVGGKYPQHRHRNRLKTQCSHRHQRHAEQDGADQGHLTAADASGGIIEADDGHDAGLHGAERDEEEGLPFVIQAQGRHSLIGKAGEDQIEAENIKCICGLHENIGNPQPKNLRDSAGINLLGGRLPIPLFHHHQRCRHLAHNSRNGGSRNAQFRQSEPSKNQQRIQHNVGDRSQNLGCHGRFHISLRLKDLGPDALKKQPETEHTYDAAVCHRFCNHLGRRRGQPCIGRHQQPGNGGKKGP